MFLPQSPYTRIAYETIDHYLKHGQLKNLKLTPVPPDLYELKRGCFVSIHLQDDELRGCIGTIEAQEDNLVEEIKRNSISAAFRDHRFQPLTKKEFPIINLSVDVLTEPELIFSIEDLDPSIFGVIVSDGKHQKGVLLPSIPGIDSVEKQIAIVKRKAGLHNVDDQQLVYYRFTSNRYH